MKMRCPGCDRTYEERPNNICPSLAHWRAYAELVERGTCALKAAESETKRLREALVFLSDCGAIGISEAGCIFCLAASGATRSPGVGMHWKGCPIHFALDTCSFIGGSSRMCERGTKSCEVRHVSRSSEVK